MARLFDDSSSEFGQIDVAVVSGPPFTVSLWAYADDVTLGMACFWIGDKDATGDYYRIQLNGDVAGDFVIGTASVSGSAVNATTSAGMSVNTWHHLCFVVRSTTDREMYIDGGNSGTSTTSKNVTAMDRTAIGRMADSTPKSYWSGRLDKVMVWDASLNTSEISALAAGVPNYLIRSGNIAARWDVDGIESPEVDLSGNANNLTMTGTVRANSSPASLEFPTGIVFASAAAGGATPNNLTLLGVG